MVWGIVGGAAFGLVLFVLIFALVARLRERAIARLASEGIERRSGGARFRIRLQGYRGHGIISGMRAIKPGELVLTREHLYAFIPFPLPLSGADLSNLRVRARGDSLEVETEHPFEATGTVALSFTCNDAPDWVAVLSARGATPKAD